MDERPPLSAETLAAQALGESDPLSGGLTPVINPSTSYERRPDGAYHDGRVYSRADNPTYEYAEQILARLEGGAGCALFASGMAAATAIFQSLLPGDHVLVARLLYWGVRKWLAEFGLTWGLDVEFVDTTDLAAVQRAIRPGRTRLIWVESPANPTWDITDLATLARIAHAADALLVADNTVATPVLTRPLELGVDLVVHSATKYLNGHSDVVAGAVVTARRDPFWERVRSWRRNAGAVIGPFEAWLLQRGMRTLFLRVRQASASALTLARHFQGHPALVAVLYPGLPEHPGHAIAAAQMRGGFGGMLSIRVAGGAEQAMAVAAAVRVFKRATSLGGVESLIEHRASTEGPSSPVPADLLRLSVGIEATQDLLADLEGALAAAMRGGVLGGVAAPIPAPLAALAPQPRRPAAPSPRQPYGALAPRPSEPPAAEPSPAERVAAVLARSITPSVVARGGGLRLLAVQDGVATLEASGSPGAVLPVLGRIEALIRSAVPAVTAVRLVQPVVAPPVGEPDSRPATTGATVPAGDDLAGRVRGVLDAEIGPAVAAHGGHVALVEVRDGWARIRLHGGCQGCSLAAVTVRQGIEPLLRARIPELLGVVDLTDHATGIRPFYSPEKR